MGVNEQCAYPARLNVTQLQSWTDVPPESDIFRRSRHTKYDFPGLLVKFPNIPLKLKVKRLREERGVSENDN
jgi:hypothetical protein